MMNKRQKKSFNKRRKQHSKLKRAVSNTVDEALETYRDSEKGSNLNMTRVK